ncbi:MAG: winged helix-turn-helix transcriptional regulator [Methylovirgula sp.]
MPAKSDLSMLNCSFARALSAVGDAWSLLIIRDAFFGLARFSDFQRSSGVARNILAKRLEALIAAGIMQREGSESRPLYQLTEKGRALLPALVALMQWGDHWESGDRPPVALRDASGGAIAPIRVETSAGAAVTAETLRFDAGPGADARTVAFFSGRTPR